ncbi:unnamed protein product [Parajaminaea phylloscopi]
MMSAPQPYPTVGVNAPAPDDAQIEKKMPSICVDYLSHNWAQEDVWQSWKAMTKRKNEIANGVRLENASWRTWAKQRGNLKTINPETLNWLKDSDVTWLYGPLHEHADPVPPPKVASTQDRLDLDDSLAKKSILKHRTISEMLTTPGRTASPAVEVHMDPMDIGTPDAPPTPKTHLVSVKSDTNLTAKKRQPAGSPPASARLLSHPSLERSETTTTTGSSEEKRHISFNSRVDQCIAVDYPEEDAEEYGYSDGDYDEDSDATGSSEEEGDLLTMRSSPKTQSSGLSISSRQSSPSVEQHNTIAKLAPTLLKTSDTFPAPSPAVVDPTGFTTMGATSNAKASAAHRGAGGSGDDFEERSQWDDEPSLDYFSAPYAANRGAGVAADAPSIVSAHAQKATSGSTAGGTDRVSSGSTSTTDGDSRLSSSPGSSSANPSTVQPRSILKKRGSYEGGNGSGSGSGSTAESVEDAQNASTPAAAARVGAASAFIAENIPAAAAAAAASGTDASQSTVGAATAAASSSALASSYDSSDSQDDESGRGRSSQRLGSSTSYERIQEAARKSSSGRSGNAVGTAAGASTNASAGAGRTSASTQDASTSGARAQNSARHASGQDRERRGSFRGQDSDGQQRSGAALKLGIADVDGVDGTDDRRVSFSDDDTDSSDAAASYPAFATNSQNKGSKKVRNHSTGKSMSPAGSQRLSVDLENLPSNDPAVMGTAPTPGAGGPTPLNTPTLALARKGRRQQSGSQDSTDSSLPPHSASASSSSGHAPLSPVLPRRTSATGALVAPSGADREAGVRVPLADDFVEEDEGGIVGRAVEIVNTARDLIAAVWPTRR